MEWKDWAGAVGRLSRNVRLALFGAVALSVSRLAAGRSPFQGGQDHVSHRLVSLGLPVPYAVGTIHLGAVGIGVLTYVVSGSDPTSAWVLAGLIGVTLVVVGGVLLRVPVDLIDPGVTDPVDPLV